MSAVDESLYAQIGRHHPTSKFLASTLDPSDVRRIQQQQQRPVCLADEGLPFGMPADQLMPTPEFERLMQGFAAVCELPRAVADEPDDVAVDRRSPADDDGRFSPDAPGIAPVPAFVEVLAAEPDDDYPRSSSSTGSGRRPHQQQQQQQQQHRHNEQRKTYATLLPGSPRSSPFHGSVSDLSVRRSSPALPHHQYGAAGAVAPSMPAPVADLNGQLPYDLPLRGIASVDTASPWTTLDDTSFQIVPTVDAATRSGPASTSSSSYVDDGDRQRQDRKRERNRLAAAKCRQRKLEQIDTLQNRVDELKERNLALERTAEDLRREVAALRAVVSNHINSGCRLDLSSAGAMYN